MTDFVRRECPLCLLLFFTLLAGPIAIDYLAMLEADGHRALRVVLAFCCPG